MVLEWFYYYSSVVDVLSWVPTTYGDGLRLTGHELFPTYARGAGYALSPALCRFIAAGARGLK